VLECQQPSDRDVGLEVAGDREHLGHAFGGQLLRERSDHGVAHVGVARAQQRQHGFDGWFAVPFRDRERGELHVLVGLREQVAQLLVRQQLDAVDRDQRDGPQLLVQCQRPEVLQHELDAQQAGDLDGLRQRLLERLRQQPVHRVREMIDGAGEAIERLPLGFGCQARWYSPSRFSSSTRSFDSRMRGAPDRTTPGTAIVSTKVAVIATMPATSTRRGGPFRRSRTGRS
jgi:hypothetical protein